jgi:quercetin dioxygenase-like cupin family protein
MSTTTASRRVYNPVQKDAAIFLETVEESGGTRTLIQVELAPGGGNAVHRHLEFAEHFEVLEGALIVHLDGIDHVLRPGDTAVAAAGRLHCFKNAADTTTVFRVELRPGHRGFERVLQIAYGLAEDGRVRGDGTPKNLFHLAVLVTDSGSRIAGPLRVLEPAFGLLARIARRRGIERELALKYVTL